MRIALYVLFSMIMTLVGSYLISSPKQLSLGALIRRAHRTSKTVTRMAPFLHTDTIYALSSGGNTKSGVAVVRISGPKSLYCLEAMKSPNKDFLPPKPRVASLRSLYCPLSKELLDKALVLWFPGPNSFTGEDVLELHVHGSKAVLSGIFQALAFLDDQSSSSQQQPSSIRAAEPGEFTRRAFENGKMDLTEVEGLADLLAADTSEQRKQALRQMEGHLRRAYERWRETLMKCLAHTEAVIDFGDDDREGDINDSAMTALIPLVGNLRHELDNHLLDGRKGEIIRDGLQVVLCGPPNAGKSSLMNYLARRPAAIVSPIAGTTRDVVEVRMDIGGYPCIVRDTAGLRVNSSDIIELEGMRRAREAYDNAHIKIFVADATDKNSVEESLSVFDGLITNGEEQAKEASQYMFVLNKADLLTSNSSSSSLDISSRIQGTGSIILPTLLQYTISCTTGQGLDQLEAGLEKAINSYFSVARSSGASDDSSESVLITRERHRRHVKRCAEHLDSFLHGRLPMDAAAEEIRLAMAELGKVTGRVDVEELLDIIFRDFCIGK